ncbi:MAG: hypothetical protein M1834_002493 [Cirrosporium novae-zelandiae]|nr:MAG: hypothetical protein M1834_002493 [Cirrosporium novae-zelandiae]
MAFRHGGRVFSESRCERYVTATLDVWEEYLLRHPEAHSFRFRPILHESYLETLFGELDKNSVPDTATGFHAMLPEHIISGSADKRVGLDENKKNARSGLTPGPKQFDTDIKSKDPDILVQASSDSETRPRIGRGSPSRSPSRSPTPRSPAQSSTSNLPTRTLPLTEAINNFAANLNPKSAFDDALPILMSEFKDEELDFLFDAADIISSDDRKAKYSKLKVVRPEVFLEQCQTEHGGYETGRITLIKYVGRYIDRAGLVMSGLKQPFVLETISRS